MKFSPLVKKLNLIEKKIVTANELKEYCRIIKTDYLSAIKYLIRHKHLYRIMRGIFYNPSIRERKLGGLDMTYHEAISKALEIKGVKNWYFGLETAIKMNNLTHEFFTTEYIINDTISRAKPITVFGNKIRFIKLKPNLCIFGLKQTSYLKYSDIEKTILDFIHLLKYRSYSDELIKNKIIDYVEFASKKKLREYSKKYKKSVKDFVREL